MQLFDLHVDTATRLYYGGMSFGAPTLGAGANGGESFSPLTRVYAIFSNDRLDDETAFSDFFRMRDRLMSELAPYLSKDFSAILAVEDARLLAGRRERLLLLYEAGVRILTLTWGGISCIGGAHDTSAGLTPFGRAILDDCWALGILPDVSHASHAVFREVAAAAAERGLPFLASHSNSYTVCPHTRNLTDREFCAIRDSGGVCGISLYPPHLSTAGVATSADVLRHLDRYLSLGGEDTVALGTDLDGIDTTPADLPNTRA
ncbi:MAG: membrane dipeptidase, partial [Clostridia bacterium]|nr:membrane dipeptidase [Clostridia bacterium]